MAQRSPRWRPDRIDEQQDRSLPFKNISGDTSQDYFSDGLSEELRPTLARNLKLQVMAQTSSAKFRDHTEDAVAIASHLGVGYLLDGTVRKSGEVARITADLIDGQPGSAGGRRASTVRCTTSSPCRAKLRAPWPARSPPR